MVKRSLPNAALDACQQEVRPIVHSQEPTAPEIFRAVLASSRRGDGAEGLPASTWEDLDWPLLCERIAGYCATEDARELALSMGILPTGLWSRRMREIEELRGLRQRNATLPVGDVPSLRHALLRLRKVDALEGEDLLAIASMLTGASRVARFLSEHRERAPLCREHALSIADLSATATEIRSLFDASGELKDEASPELSRLRRRTRRLRETIQGRMDRYLREPRYEGILQDDYVTIRDDRYVLPVRAGEKGDVPGIVHGESGSGSTLYIEPESLVPLNNDLQIARAEIHAEVRRIRARLTKLLFAELKAVDHNADAIVFFDLSSSLSRLAYELNAALPSDRGDETLSLKQARHPILALRELDGELTVIPNDVVLPTGSHALVISGPNTGGKTVTLKTLGLFALMARAGMPLPCDPGSVFPVPRRVFTDIGDDQSVQTDLSTFSGHVANIASFVGDVGPGDLVLLDELFAGTDPAQATTLGRALIDELIGRGAIVVVTTHLEGLKSIAFEDERYAAASMGFDIEAMAPTYRLRSGMPGASWAHRIAQRLGIPAHIVERAESMAVPEARVSDEETLARMEDAWRQIEEERERAHKVRLELERARDELRLERAKVREKQERALDKELERARDEARKLRDEAREMTRLLREAASKPESLGDEAKRLVEEARATARRVQERTSREARAGQQGAPLSLADLQRGLSVWVVPYQQRGLVAELPSGDDIVGVQMGAIHARVPLDQLRVDQAEQGARRSEADRGAASRSAVRASAADPALRHDLRGARVDEALEQVDAYVERAMRARLPFFTLIHGHGTGALKRAIRAHLNEMPYDLRHRPGEFGEGGDGVTVVEFDPASDAEGS